jgi:isoleucyl-tRNA synthetase
MRKSAGFEIADYISTYYEGDDYILQVMKDFNEYIKLETLSRLVVHSIPEADVYSESFKLSGHSLKLAVKKETA